MADMTSMALTASERNDLLPSSDGEDDGPRFPFGLTIRLEEESIKKLGIDLPRVGSSMSVMAMAKVESIESEEVINDGRPEERRSMRLQITDLALGQNREADLAERVFGGDDG